MWATCLFPCRSSAPPRLLAVITHTIDGTGGTNRTSYLHRDHLGSVDTITDEAGSVEQRMSFDSWGKRREITWQAMADTSITTFNTDITTRGFTGHEMVDSVGLVHMNGRVYEPELGRFLSADPIVEAIDNLQTYNRYSYVQNNPLTLTDPSGFFGDNPDAMDGFPGIDDNVEGGDAKEGDAPQRGNHDTQNSQDRNNGQGSKTHSNAKSNTGLKSISDPHTPLLSEKGKELSKDEGFWGKIQGVLDWADEHPEHAELVLSSIIDVALLVAPLPGTRVALAARIASRAAVAATRAVRASRSARGAARNARNAKFGKKTDCNSFAAGTPVLTSSGLTSIELLKAGDEVLARDKKTGEESYKPIVQTFNNNYNKALNLSLQSENSGKPETVVVTFNHKIFVKDKGWIRADQIKEGDNLSQAGGKWVKVVNVTEYQQRLTAYNFEVKDYNTYFVGNQKVWVHNCKKGEKGYKHTTVGDRSAITNGKYTTQPKAMDKHKPGTAPKGKSTFRSDVDAEKATLDAAKYADKNNLWRGNKAKVPARNGPVGYHGRTGEPLNNINVYRNDNGLIHGSPGR